MHVKLDHVRLCFISGIHTYVIIGPAASQLMRAVCVFFDNNARDSTITTNTHSISTRNSTICLECNSEHTVLHKIIVLNDRRKNKSSLSYSYNIVEHFASSIIKTVVDLHIHD